MNKIDIARLPELKTVVGIHGSARQVEVGGPVCLGAVLALALLARGLQKPS